jgi:hypothetical protein
LRHLRAFTENVSFQSNEDVIRAMFKWWNESFEHDTFSIEGFARFFGSKAKFIVDGNIRGEGPAALLTFFNSQRVLIETAVLKLPLLTIFSSGKHVSLDYDMCVGPRGAAKIVNAKGYAQVEGQQIVHYAVNTCPYDLLDHRANLGDRT